MGACLSNEDASDGSTVGSLQRRRDSSTHSRRVAPPPQPSPPSPPSPSLLPPPQRSPPPYPSPFSHLQVPVLGRPFKNVRDHYKLDEILGNSKSYRSRAYLCIEKSTGRKYACKSFFKHRLAEPSDRDAVRREIKIMKYLSGEPNIVEFRAAYEDNGSVFVVMELCTCDDVFRMISSDEGRYTERAIASIIRDIVTAVKACHDLDVMHRDIKPEKFLLSSEEEGAVLKAFDFRHSRVIERGKKYRYPLDISYYLAPEVLKGSYGKEIDIWSVGVILYMLLSGEPPFYAETEEKLKVVIRYGVVDFDSQPWPSVSNTAKQLTQKMLTVNPKKRISPEEVLDFPWISGGEASDEPMDSTVLTRLKRFRERDNLK